MEEFSFLADLYKDIHFWLSGITPGEYTCISRYKKYDKDVWNIIKNKIIELENKKELTTYEKDFLKCKYTGNAYRVINYNPRKHGYVYAFGCYQSCSKTLSEVKNVGVYGEKILIELIAKHDAYAIDMFELLCFMVKNEIIRFEDVITHNLSTLERYECEGEVIVPLDKSNIKNVKVVNFEQGIEKELEPSKWYRNNLY